MIELYNKVCKDCSKLITNEYSTSFSLGIKMFDKRFRAPIYAIYGFVRLADEIVDTFHKHDKRKLLQQFSEKFSLYLIYFRIIEIVSSAELAYIL